MASFWWNNSQGNDIWANVKYERLFDFCYRCGKLDHTTQSCKDKVQMSKTKSVLPLYGPWLIEIRPKSSHPMRMSGGTERKMTQAKRAPHRTWFSIMNEVRDPRNKNQNVSPITDESPDVGQTEEE